MRLGSRPTNLQGGQWPLRISRFNPSKVTIKKIFTLKLFKNLLLIIRMNTNDCSKKIVYFKRKIKKSGGFSK